MKFHISLTFEGLHDCTVLKGFLKMLFPVHGI